MRPTALLVAAALIGFGAAGAQANPDHYLFVVGGVTTSDDMNVIPDGIDNDLDERDQRNLRSVLVADVDTDAKTVTNWRRAGLLPLIHPTNDGDLHWNYLHSQVTYLDGRIYVGPATIFSTASDLDPTTANFVAWAEVNTDGSLGDFQMSDPFPEPPSTNQRIGGQAIVEVDGTNYIYVLGGSQDEEGFSDRILYAAIDGSTGAVGAWSTASITIPTTDWFNPAIGIDGTLIHISGNLRGGMFVDLITPQANGDLVGDWISEQYSTALTNSWEEGVAAVTDPLGDTYLYIVAGSPAPRDRYYYTSFEFGLTGVWESGTLPAERGRTTAAAANDMIVLPGGSTGSGFGDGVNTVFIGTIAEGGAVTWEESPEPMMQARSFHGSAMAPVEDEVSVPEWMLY